MTSKKKGAIPRFRCVNSRNCHNATADYDKVEREIISSLRNWLSGYKIKIETKGFEEEIARCDEMIAEQEEKMPALKKQLDNAFDLVEQGVYTLELFKERREKIEQSMGEVRQRLEMLRKSKAELEERDGIPKLIPQTEQLLESYYEMSPEERNRLLKAVLCKVEYKREAGGKIEIDLFPRLPKL